MSYHWVYVQLPNKQAIQNLGFLLGHHTFNNQLCMDMKGGQTLVWKNNPNQSHFVMLVLGPDIVHTSTPVAFPIEVVLVACATAEGSVIARKYDIQLSRLRINHKLIDMDISDHTVKCTFILMPTFLQMFQPHGGEIDGGSQLQEAIIGGLECSFVWRVLHNPTWTEATFTVDGTVHQGAHLNYICWRKSLKCTPH